MAENVPEHPTAGNTTTDDMSDAERSAVLREVTLGDLAIAMAYHRISAADLTSIFDGIIFPLIDKLSQWRGRDEVAEAAVRLAIGSIRVLLTPRTPDDSTVLRLDAIARFAGARADTIAIIELAEVVKNSVRLRRMNDPVLHRARRWSTEEGWSPVPPDSPMFGEQAPARLRDWLVLRCGLERVPTVDQIAEWLDKHSERRARGKLTIAGIVARILHRGRLLGANTGDEKAMLQRVDKVLARALK